MTLTELQRLILSGSRSSSSIPKKLFGVVCNVEVTETKKGWNPLKAGSSILK